MNSRDFCFWLQGMFELTNLKALDEKQVELIRRHLQMVFIHEIDPSFPPEQQQALSQTHHNQTIPLNHGIPTEHGVRC